MQHQLFILCVILTMASCHVPESKSQDASSTQTESNLIIREVDPSLFLTKQAELSVTKVPCMLSDGSESMCYQIVSTSTPSDHTMGPWCPQNINDGAEAGGIWLKDGKVYDVDGAFIKNMATLYQDDTWLMYDEQGDIYRTKTQKDCAAAANPNVGEEYANYCVECLPSYVADISQTYMIPVKPVMLDNIQSFGGRGGGKKGKEPRPDGPPPGGKKPDGPPPGKSPGNGSSPSVRGLAFNGVRFDAPAPVDVILEAYTVAPFDDAGGHINMHVGYHYHTATGMTTEIAQEDGHAPMIGYAMDGHGMYALLDENGLEPEGLDSCRGHYDEVRGYHYHVDAAGRNNFINCLKGALAK